MKKSRIFQSLFAVAAVAVAFSSCTKEEGNDIVIDYAESGESRYVVVATPASGSADIILYTDDLSKNLTTVGYGRETGQTGSQWYFYNDEYVYGFKYADGDDVSVERYSLNGSIVSSGSYIGNRFTTYGSWGDYVITSSSNAYSNYYSATGNTPIKESYYDSEVYPRYMQISKYNTKSGKIEPVEFMSDNYLGTGEYTNFAGFAVSDGKLYVSVYPMGATAYGTETFKSNFESTSAAYYNSDSNPSSKYMDYVSPAWGGSNSGSFKPGEIPTTPFPDQFHVAIFDSMVNFPHNPSKIITDPSMSPVCGRKSSAQYPTIVTDSQENVYLFSPGNERSYTSGYELYKTVDKADADIVTNPGSADGLYYRALGTHAASVMRIKKGENALDSSYELFDLETAMDGHSFLCCWSIKGSDKFLVQAYTGTGAQSGNPYLFYVVDPANRVATKVTGMPSESIISAVSRNPFFEDGDAFVGISTSDNQQPAIYKISSSTASAEKISTVTGYTIQSIGKLTSK